MINAKLAKLPACEGVKVVSITPIDDERAAFDWNANWVRFEEPISAECERVFNEIVEQLTSRFSLMRN